MLGIIAFAFTVKLNEYATVIITIIGALGTILAKEFNLFATRRRQMEREHAYLEKLEQEAEQPVPPPNSNHLAIGRQPSRIPRRFIAPSPLGDGPNA